MLRAPRRLAVALTAVGLAACGDASAPTQPDPEAGGPVPAPAFAVAANSWTPKAALNTAARGLDAAEVTIAPGHSLVYAIGGNNEEFTGHAVQAYDLATNTWTQKQSRFFRFNTNGTGKIGTIVYVSGGYGFISGSEAIVGGLFAYNPLTDEMTQKTDMPLRTADGVTGVISGRLHVLPGACSGEGYPFPGYCAVEPIRTFYRYDPVTDAWVTRRSCPHFHRSAGAGVINGKFYVVGGSNDKGVGTSTLDVYDPVTNTWITRAPMPTKATFVRATVLQNKLFVVARTVSGNQLVFKAYAYDPVTNTWKTRAAPPTGGALARIQLDGQARVLSVGGGGFFNGPPVASQLYTP